MEQFPVLPPAKAFGGRDQRPERRKGCPRSYSLPQGGGLKTCLGTLSLRAARGQLPIWMAMTPAWLVPACLIQETVLTGPTTLASTLSLLLGHVCRTL